MTDPTSIAVNYGSHATGSTTRFHIYIFLVLRLFVRSIILVSFFFSGSLGWRSPKDIVFILRLNSLYSCMHVKSNSRIRYR